MWGSLSPLHCLVVCYLHVGSVSWKDDLGCVHSYTILSGLFWNKSKNILIKMRVVPKIKETRAVSMQVWIVPAGIFKQPKHLIGPLTSLYSYNLYISVEIPDHSVYTQIVSCPDPTPSHAQTPPPKLVYTGGGVWAQTKPRCDLEFLSNGIYMQNLAFCL